MKSLEINGKTVQEAVQKGLERLDLDAESVEIEVLSEPSSGFFGLLGSKQATVRITEKKSPEKFIIAFLARLLELMELRGETEIESDEETLRINVSGARMGVMIGKRGQTLNSLQYLLNVIYHKKFPGQSRRIILDVEDYRQKREQTLRELAEKIAAKVALYRREVVLEPMNPQERRIIHTTLQGNPSVETYSQGEDPYRKVVIAPK
ncbi:MAG: protein jag [Dethiobacter sp.]|jgi:spoIIIJ-associated protein|nr:protein jag [Dethiobacter sp.]